MAGAVRLTLGAAFETVTVRALLVVWAPRLSVATAVIVWLPTGTPAQS